jgi:hypothetical protein
MERRQKVELTPPDPANPVGIAPEMQEKNLILGNIKHIRAAFF